MNDRCAETLIVGNAQRLISEPIFTRKYGNWTILSLFWRPRLLYSLLMLLFTKFWCSEKTKYVGLLEWPQKGIFLGRSILSHQQACTNLFEKYYGPVKYCALWPTLQRYLWTAS